MLLHAVLYWLRAWVNFTNTLRFSMLFLSMLIDKQLWYARVGLYNINNNRRFLLRTRHNTTKIFYDPFNWDTLLTVFFIIEMLIIFVCTWSVHYNKAHFEIEKICSLHKVSCIRNKKK